MTLFPHEVKLKFNNFALYSNKFLDETCFNFTYIKKMSYKTNGSNKIFSFPRNLQTAS